MKCDDTGAVFFWFLLIKYIMMTLFSMMTLPSLMTLLILMTLLPRYEDGVLVIPKALVKSPISAYENTLEVFYNVDVGQIVNLSFSRWKVWLP